MACHLCNRKLRYYKAHHKDKLQKHYSLVLFNYDNICIFEKITTALV